MSAPNQTARPDVPRRRLSDDDLRNLRLLGLVAPVLFIALVIATHPFLVDALGHEHGFNVVGAVMVVAAAAFGWGMYRLIGRAHAEVLAREEALAATQARHQLVTERQAAALTERDRIARELHDSLAQVLGVAISSCRPWPSAPRSAAPSGSATRSASSPSSARTATTTSARPSSGSRTPTSRVQPCSPISRATSSGTLASPGSRPPWTPTTPPWLSPPRRRCR